MDGQNFVSLTDAEKRHGVSRLLLGRRIRSGDLIPYRDPRDHRKTLVRVMDVEALMQPRPAPRKETAAPAA